MAGRRVKSACPRFFSSTGLTLIEILIVILIISILSVISVYTLTQLKRKAVVTVLRHDLKQFFMAQQQYLTDYDTFKGVVGDVVSNDPNTPSTISLESFSPSPNTIITVTNDDPFTAEARQRGTKIVFECFINNGTIIERRE